MNNVEKMKELEKRMASGKRNFKRQKNIFYRFKDGENIIRLVGLFKKTKTHFIAPPKKNKDGGVCTPDAFEGDERLSYVINCPDWDIENEKDFIEKKCPICKMHYATKRELRDAGVEIDTKTKKYLEEIQSRTRPSYGFKWNVIDRRDPYIIEEDGDDEKQVKGYKVVTIGMEIWKGVKRIFEQVKRDVADEEQGIDLCVKRGHNGVRIAYEVQPVMEGLQAKETPLTDEEKEMQLHDLEKLSSKKTEPEQIIAYLNPKLKDYLDAVDGGERKSFTFDVGDDETESNTDDENNEDNISSESVEKTLEKIKDEEDVPEYTGEQVECFGSAEDDHPECQKCSSFEACKVERDKNN